MIIHPYTNEVPVKSLSNFEVEQILFRMDYAIEPAAREGYFGFVPPVGRTFVGGFTFESVRFYALTHLVNTGMIYLHKKGGIYRFDRWLRDAEEPTEFRACYEHIWPHAREFWVRSKAEFLEPDRFSKAISVTF